MPDLDTRIAEIAGRAEAATEGPWRVGSPRFICLKHRPPHPGPPECEYTQTGWYDFGGIHQDREYAPADSDDGMVAGTWDYDRGGVRSEADASFIANARSDIPFLLAALQQTREALRVAADLLREEGYDGDVDYVNEWFKIEAALAPEQTEGAA